MSNNNLVLVFVELAKDNTIMPISLESLNTGKRLADGYGGKLATLIMGRNIGNMTKELRHYGADIVYTVDNPMLEHYQPDCYVMTFKQIYEKVTPEVIIMGDTLTSIDLAPRLAFSFGAGLVTDCVGIIFDSGDVRFIKPVYSSNIMAEFSLASKPYMVTIRSRSSEPACRSDTAKGEIIPFDISLDASLMKTEVIERIEAEDEGPKLANANVVVAGGRGIGGTEGFEQLLDLARVLGGAIGASRPPCDLGWVPSKAQVGQTGTIVGPSVYIAVGISGSTQHIAGISGSKVIVAINRDASANIFKIADFGVVGNYEEVVPAFKDSLKEILGSMDDGGKQ